jgi:response regulator RpfG family c-di-GMP phosphodiesterase
VGTVNVANTGRGPMTEHAGGKAVDGLLLVEREEIDLPVKPEILVVDDEHSLLKLISSILTAGGHTNDLASSVRDALRALGGKTYDIVFLDLGLPDGSGLSVLEKIVEMSPRCLVIVITGVHDLQTAVKSIRKGAYDYITKPFSVMLFQERFSTVLEEWKSRVFAQSYQDYLEKLVRDSTSTLSTTERRIEHVYDTTVKALGKALDLRDPETEEHCRRVSANSTLLGECLGVGGQQLKDLKWGSYLHDIGKIGIPEGILLKPGNLTEDEMAVVKKHAQLGYSMIKNIDFLEDAGQVVLFHHEKWNGSGYSMGLKGKDIPLNARIFAVSDAFDAMIVDRPYRKAMSFEVVAAELGKCSGTHFDPDVVDRFLRIPCGELQTGGNNP